MNPEKKHSFLIFTMFPTRTLPKILPINVYKFKIPTATGTFITSFYVLITVPVICPIDDSNYRESNRNILAGLN